MLVIPTLRGEGVWTQEDFLGTAGWQLAVGLWGTLSQGNKMENDKAGHQPSSSSHTKEVYTHMGIHGTCLPEQVLLFIHGTQCLLWHLPEARIAAQFLSRSQDSPLLLWAMASHSGCTCSDSVSSSALHQQICTVKAHWALEGKERKTTSVSAPCT